MSLLSGQMTPPRWAGFDEGDLRRLITGDDGIVGVVKTKTAEAVKKQMLAMFGVESFEELQKKIDDGITETEQKITDIGKKIDDTLQNLDTIILEQMKVYANKAIDTLTWGRWTSNQLRAS